MQFLHLYCLPAQLRKPPILLHWLRGMDPRAKKEFDMRILEMATAGLIALGAQMLVVGAVLI